MRKENLTTLLWLMCNHVHYLESKEEIQKFLKEVHDFSTQILSDEDKKSLYWETVHALNGGNEERAFYIRLVALTSGDTTLIDHIEHLHSVI